MPIISPYVRISLGLVFFTLGLLLAADFIGLIPNKNATQLDARKKNIEALAIQISYMVSTQEQTLIKKTLDEVTLRNTEILSAAVRLANNKMLVVSGEHLKYWGYTRKEKSTETQVNVPIVRDQKLWGNLEIAYTPIAGDDGIIAYLRNSVYGLILYVAIAGFIGFWFLIRRVMRELDPSAVIPDRVKNVFDTLTEGVIILDEKQHIVLSNSAFSDIVGLPAHRLIGRKSQEIKWTTINREKHGNNIELPWMKTLTNSISYTGIPLAVENNTNKQKIILTVNTASILDEKKKTKGVLITFNNMNELHEKKTQLEKTVADLEISQNEVAQQNKKLVFLANRDSLTGCLNRRAFNRESKELFDQYKPKDKPLCFIMADIDHFKKVNDNFGHAEGDKVIKHLADVLLSCTREEDVVGRYGGEEFCVVLPATEVADAKKIAERIRMVFKQGDGIYETRICSTVSLGLAVISPDCKDMDELNCRADSALYLAKNKGRNRVEIWSSKQSNDSNVTSHNFGDTVINTEEARRLPVANESSEIHTLKNRIQELEGLADERQSQIVHASYFDKTTGLPNEHFLADRIEQAIQRASRNSQIGHSRIMVMTLEIDILKRINPMLGKSAIKQILREICENMNDILRRTDAITMLSDKGTQLLSHLDKGELGILFSDLSSPDQITWIIKRIIECLKNPLNIDDNEILLTSNIGISMFPEDGKDADELIKNARLARQHTEMLDNKHNYQFYNEELNQLSATQLRIESELSRGITQQQFEMYYQLKLDTLSGRVYGMEALIRWNHPDKGVLPPAYFLDIAENTGLINNLGLWSLEAVCQQLNAWDKQGLPDISIAINLSPKQMRDPKLFEQIKVIVDKYNVTYNRLEFEITEGAVINNIDVATKTMQQLYEAGFSIAIDDFGTEYAVLKYLKIFPAEYIKIDRTFITDIHADKNDQIIVRAIIAIAHSMDMKVVAEGVETQQQADFLKRLDCDALQGYLFSEPVTQQLATDILLGRNNTFNQVLAGYMLEMDIRNSTLLLE